MADAPPAGQQTQNVLTRKVGPFPVWVWAAIGAGIYFWYTRYGPGASAASGTSQAVDPNTGVPYPQELAAAQQQSGEPITVDVGAVNVTDNEPGPPPKRPPPRRPPPKRPPPRRRPPPTSNWPGGRQPPPPRRRLPVDRGPVPGGVSASRGPLDRPGEVNTVNGSPVYDQWTADHDGVPEPQPAYAPMTAGSIYG